MSCLNYHLITGFGQLAGDDVPSWLLDFGLRMLFPHIKNPPETLWHQAVVYQYLPSLTPGSLKFQVGKISTLSVWGKWVESRRGSGRFNFPSTEIPLLQENKLSQESNFSHWTFIQVKNVLFIQLLCQIFSVPDQSIFNLEKKEVTIAFSRKRPSCVLIAWHILHLMLVYHSGRTHYSHFVYGFSCGPAQNVPCWWSVSLVWFNGKMPRSCFDILNRH